ncbi:beta-ketoacyl-[acyl-carrier-protein] synthase family protein [Marinoscillum furvescens]|uniref:3-oxoacyl-[acyl-carrier-protein] synthase 1 n=1 Tax=Marinoscillum furvescens DSM 4134 TaxID=1122208 RepID=A0A3D9L1R8_MARFU|nr:beta-ketoacyl-[acyl-carrier-protein] synthase family protein [Marinoscillum furvescens]RED98008.1 3-oxoacyl-(acyl-carrier-protein) synthase [Marinoscillum furvescens DSM 4134]
MSQNKRRVVITGLGVVAPNGLNVNEFTHALKTGVSGIKRWENLEEINFKCQIGGKPPVSQEYKDANLPDFIAKKVKNNAVIYACLSGLEAWKDAGLEIAPGTYDRKTGMIIGSGALGLDSFIEHKIYPIDKGNHRRLGSRSVPESMSSGAGAYLNGILGLTGRIFSNSSACITGSEAILQGYELILSGRMDRMLCGSTEGDGRYIWGGFDAMRVLCSDSNDHPERGSRPMSASSSGFVPSGGSGALVLETLDSALKRGATIYAEVMGGEVNSGGQQNGGSMTAQNPEAVVDCIQSALDNASMKAEEIDLISGHLTSTKGDPYEINNWVNALRLDKDRLPFINTPKSMIGHCVAGAGSIELVASVIQLKEGFVHGNLNLEEIHPQISEIVPQDKLPTQSVDTDIQSVIKANFGFGDLNCCIVLKKWND